MVLKTNLFAASVRSFAIAMAVLGFSTSSLMAGTWSRATGEAVELQRTTKDLRNRMSRVYGYLPATQNAVVLDQLAAQLISLTKSNISPQDLQYQLDQFDTVYQDVRIGNATEGALAADNNVARYTAEISRRFDRLVKDLGRAKVPVYVGALPQIFNPPLLGSSTVIESTPLVQPSQNFEAAPLVGSAPIVEAPLTPRDEAVVRYRIPRLLDRILGGEPIVEQPAPAPVPAAPLPRISL